MSALSITNVTKSFGDNHILKGISLEAEAGEFIALVGPSGCGKSTLLRIVAGLEGADSGEIVAGGRDLTRLVAAERNVAMVFQSYALYPHLTAGQNIAVPLAMRNLTSLQRLPMIGSMLPGQKAIRKDILRQVTDMARSLKIDHLLDRKPGQMSGGQRQRVALARAMVRQPGLFLMDEPLSNLDANLRVHARGEIVDLHRRAGVPTLYVTHDQAEALSMADRVAVMMSGSLLQLAAPEVIYDDPAHIEVAKFVGQPRINTIASRVDADGAVTLGTWRLQPHERLVPGTDITVAIRSEFLSIADMGTPGLPAHIERLEFLGSEVIVYTKLDAIGESMVVKLAPSDARGLVAGKPVTIVPQGERLMVFGADGARLRADLTFTTLLERAHG
ncbi:ATP-binding cassette domain-containing protein [Rhizobiales bacterium RZME27]|uniref:ATP-binding cassette domain-containing protein n=1 Tax=Endobacterium cereale TaxID=2663029 RepID=A0A6A8AFI3_9HYPH|nr:ABC transporter ATP-binding protein [Endobacterium cereale]MEB2843144.1 ABC transporter ATP-binding protein [Endobacterium cereale]MQY49534.1 ATP-binding cassette domain-containing protein [Endobacterium cereale]